jgi:hypothetical protein
MGHASSSFLLQQQEFDRTYSNPYKQGGKGIKYTKWRTVSGFSHISGGLEAAKKWWKESYEQRDPAKLTRFRVQYKGKTVINPEGRVYQAELALGGRQIHMRFVEALV